jgi:hypothetical protein
MGPKAQFFLKKKVTSDIGLVRLVASQPAVFFSHTSSAPATSQSAVFFSHNKSASATSHQPAERDHSLF